MTRPNGALGRELLYPLPGGLLPAATLAFVVAGAMLWIPAHGETPPERPNPDLQVFRELWRPATPHLLEMETTQVQFDSPEASQCLGEGWETRDKLVFSQRGYVWATRLHAELYVTVLQPRPLVLSLSLMPNALESLPEQKVQVVWEDARLGTCTLEESRGWRRKLFRVAVPEGAQKPGQNTITLLSRYAVSRKDVDEGTESREAAVALLALSLAEPGEPAGAPRQPAPVKFGESSLLQPARTRIRFPMHLPPASDCSLHFEDPASTLAECTARVLLRWDAVAGPQKTVLYAGSNGATDGHPLAGIDLTPWAGQIVEIIFDTSEGRPGSIVEWVRPRLLAGLAAPGGERVRAPALTPEFPPVSNVVLVVLDALRADATGCYGNPHDCSPFLDTLATTGMLFERCHAAATQTFASTTSLLTSLHPFQHGVIWEKNRLADETLLLQRRLGADDVFTGCVSQNPFVSPGNVLGRHFDEFREVFGPNLETCQQVTRAALEVASQAEGRRLFLYVHYLPPHAPYDMAERYRHTLSLDPIEALGVNPADMHLARKGRIPVDIHAAEQLGKRYLENVRFADSLLADLVHGLRELGFGAETALVVTSDHGESQGQHDWFGHQGIPYQTQAHIPLVMTTLAPRGLGSAVRRRDVAHTVDIYPTICALLGTPLGGAPVEGASLLEARPGRDDRVLAFCHGLRQSACEAYFLERYKLLVSRTRSWLEVYDLARDPLETTNLAGTFPVLANHLLALANAWQAARREAFTLVDHDAVSGATPATVAPEHVKELEALGYL